MKLSAAIRSMRLRTLPLSLSGTVCGTAMAWACQGVNNIACAAMLALTTISLQVLSNLSNELGDYLSGTDSHDRQGPNYSLTSGQFSEQDLRLLIRLAAAACCIFGLAMIWLSFGTLCAWQPLLLLLMGAAAIWAAIHYTLGHNPYGYRGLGDIFVFVFFGLVSVVGAYFVVCHQLDQWEPWIVGAAIGCFSVGVLNVNNLRDMATDQATRTTTPLRLGERRAKIYHTLLIALGWICLLTYTVATSETTLHYLYLVVMPLHVVHIIGVWQRSGRALDPMLPLLVMSTFMLSLLFAAGILL